MHVNYLAPWAPGGTYHIYNRAVALNRLFCTTGDARKFRSVLLKKISPFIEVYALALVGNHFHLHGRVRSLEEIDAYLRSGVKLLRRQQGYLAGDVGFQELIGDVFGRAFQGYARSFNLRHRRTGSLFNQTLPRLRVEGDVISRRLCAYIHFNAFKHSLWKSHLDLGNLTTYAEIVCDQSKLVRMDKVFARFGGEGAFIAYHEEYLRRFGGEVQAFDENKYFGYVNSTDRFHYQLVGGDANDSAYLWAGSGGAGPLPLVLPGVE